MSNKTSDTKMPSRAIRLVFLEALSLSLAAFCHAGMNSNADPAAADMTEWVGSDSALALKSSVASASKLDLRVTDREKVIAPFLKSHFCTEEKLAKLFKVPNLKNLASIGSVSHDLRVITGCQGLKSCRALQPGEIIKSCQSLSTDAVINSFGGDLLSFVFSSSMNERTFVTLNLEGRKVFLDKAVEPQVSAKKLPGLRIFNGSLTGLPVPDGLPPVPKEFTPPDERTDEFKELNPAMDFSHLPRMNAVLLEDVTIRCKSDHEYMAGQPANPAPGPGGYSETIQRRTTCDGIVLDGNYTKASLENVQIYSPREFGLLDKHPGGDTLMLESPRFMHDAASPPLRRTSVAVVSQAKTLEIAGGNFDYYRVNIFSTGATNHIWGNHICAGNPTNIASVKVEDIYLTQPHQINSAIEKNYIDNGIVRWTTRGVKGAGSLDGLWVKNNYWLTIFMRKDPTLASDNPNGAFAWMVLDYSHDVKSRTLANFRFTNNLMSVGAGKLPSVPWAANPLSLEALAVGDNQPIQNLRSTWISGNSASVDHQVVPSWVNFHIIQHPVSAMAFDAAATTNHQLVAPLPFSCTPSQIETFAAMAPSDTNEVIDVQNPALAPSGSLDNSYMLTFSTAAQVKGAYHYRISCNEEASGT